MEFKDLLNFIEKQDGRLKKAYESYPDEEKRILARTVKLGEEVGELCDEILSYNSMQRKDKLDKVEKENLAREVADVLITTLLIAYSTNVDVEKALEDKIEKINERFKDFD